MTQAQTQTEPSGTRSTVELVAIPPDDIPYCRDLIVKKLQPAIELAEGRLIAEDVIDCALDGKMQLFALMRINEPVLAMLATEIIEYPGARVCKVLFLAGEKMSEWKHCLEDLEEWAAYEDCTQIEIQGREGWGRVYPEYHRSYTSFVKELGDG